MQTLGLSSEPKPTDNLFKRLFWPSIESGYDVDLLGQQGFWLCTGVAALTGLSFLIAGWPTLGMIFVLAFFLGGCGVRERSLAAAVIVFLLYAVNATANVIVGGFGNPLITLVVLMLLVSNIRGTVLARLWAERPEHQQTGELPERGRHSVGERFPTSCRRRSGPSGSTSSTRWRRSCSLC